MPEFCREVAGGVVTPAPDEPLLFKRCGRDSLSEGWFVFDCFSQVVSISFIADP